MIRKLLPLVLASAIALPAFASGDLKLDDARQAQIREQLTAQGYEVRKVKIEDGMYEAYATKDGHKYEIYLDAALNVVKVDED